MIYDNRSPKEVWTEKSLYVGNLAWSSFRFFFLVLVERFSLFFCFCSQLHIMYVSVGSRGKQLSECNTNTCFLHNWLHFLLPLILSCYLLLLLLFFFSFSENTFYFIFFYYYFIQRSPGFQDELHYFPVGIFIYIFLLFLWELIFTEKIFFLLLLLLRYLNHCCSCFELPHEFIIVEHNVEKKIPFLFSVRKRSQTFKIFGIF